MSAVKLSKTVKGRKVNQWNLVTESWKDKRSGELVPTNVIRRWVVEPDGKGTTERYPREKYASIADNLEELNRLVRRLNETEFKEELKKEAILDRIAGLFEKDLTKYEVAVRNRIPSEGGVQREMNMLRTHVVNVFVGRLKLSNPKDWYAKGRDDFMEYLLSAEAPGATYTKTQIVQVANRFVRWLHDERPSEVPQMIFPLPGKSMRLAIERRRVASGQRKKREGIHPSDWKVILEAMCKKEWNHLYAPSVLARRYGLRRRETFGLAFEGTDAVTKKYLSVKRQMISWNPNDGPTFDLLKTPGRMSDNSMPEEERKIPHYFDLDPEETCDLIETLQSNLMHPDTFSHDWADLMTQLFNARKIRKRYEFHEIRHAWITEARSKYSSRDVQLAAGHKSIATTEGYSHDHRDLDDAPVRPRKAG